jgi:hypothetical protein
MAKERKLPAIKDEMEAVIAGGYKPGRPTIRTPEMEEEIFSRLANGESLRKICMSDHMPDRVTVFRWNFSDPVFASKYAQAREMQAETHVDEMTDISDDSANDFIETDDGTKLNAEHIQRSKLRIETRRWIAEKLKPKKYGVKLEIAGDPSAPIKTENTIDISGLSLEQLTVLETVLGKITDGQ